MADDRLYNLLPEYYRTTDIANGGQLQALLRVIAEQVDVVQADIDQLYRNWFIETCQDWVVPYIGDLVGYQPLSMGEATQSTTPEAERLERASEPRPDVARTIATRRRKGTLSVLVELARDVADWPARAVEFYTALAKTQSINHVRLHRGRTVDMRNGDLLDLVHTPFDRLAHTVDVRRVDSSRTPGRFNIPEVGLFVWRLGCYSLTRTPAYCWDDVRNQYSFSILGNDVPLMTLPQTGGWRDPGITDVPDWIRRRAFSESLFDYYEPSASLCIWRDDPGGAPIPADDIIPADLSDWTYTPSGSKVAVDPVLGRIAFATAGAPKTGVWVTYHLGFSADMGGGEYLRPRPPIGERRVYTVGTGGDFDAIMAAISQWQSDKAGDAGARDAVIEVVDSGVYQESISLTLDEGDQLELRAAPQTRPVILLLEAYNRPGAMRVTGTGQPPGGATAPEVSEPQAESEPPPASDPPAESEPPLPKVSSVTGCVEFDPTPLPTFTLDGFLVAGRSLMVAGPIAQLTLRHCTLVPGWALQGDCNPQHAERPSVELNDTPAKLIVDHSIIGSIEVQLDEPTQDPIDVVAHDSIIDATRTDMTAICSAAEGYAYVRLRVVRCTVIGTILVHTLELGTNSILLGELQVARRQQGCARFSWIEPGSRSPRRYECQPDLVIATVTDAVAAGTVPAADVAIEKAAGVARVRPQLASLRYGTPVYCQLAPSCAPEISRGGDDEAEMGAFHDLFQPQRLANLGSRLADFTPAGMDAGIIVAT